MHPKWIKVAYEGHVSLSLLFSPLSISITLYLHLSIYMFKYMCICCTYLYMCMWKFLACTYLSINNIIYNHNIYAHACVGMRCAYLLASYQQNRGQRRSVRLRLAGATQRTPTKKGELPHHIHNYSQLWGLLWLLSQIHPNPKPYLVPEVLHTWRISFSRG